MAVVDLTRVRKSLQSLELLRCRGSVVRVTGMTVESLGPPAGVGQLVDICLSDGRRVPAEVVGFHGERRVLLPLEGIEGVEPAAAVFLRSSPRHITLGQGLLGRVLDGLGRPLDGLGPIADGERRALDAAPPAPMSRPPIRQVLTLGIRALDGLLTCGRGQRVGIFAGSGVGKSTLLGDIARSSDADVNVVALVGERGREVREFMDHSLGPRGLARSVVVVATSDTSPIQRVKAAFLAVTVAEFFRDSGRHVLLMMDSLTRLAQAQREIGLAAGEPPTSKGYCPSVFSLLPRLTERMGCSDRGSITALLTVLAEGDDLGDPVADSARSLLDGHVVLSRKLAEVGHYPAVDILQSVSRLMTSVASREHLDAARKLRAIYSTYQSAEDLITIGAIKPGANPRLDRAIALIDSVRAFLVQSDGPSTLEATLKAMAAIAAKWDAAAGREDGK